MRTHHARRHAGPVLVVLVASVLLIGPALARPGTRVAGLPGDPAAEVWSLQELRDGRLGLVAPTTTPAINVPDGSHVRRPVAITTALVDALGALLVHVVRATTARNLVLLLGAATNGLAMLVAASRLRLGRVAATVAAVAFLTAPSLIVETRLHMALVFAGTVPLAFALGLDLLERPGGRRAMSFGAVVGGSCYVNPYVPLYTAVVALAIGLVVLQRHRARGARAMAIAVAATIAVAAPALVLLTVRRAETLAEVDRPLAELDTYATRPLDLLRAFGPLVVGLVIVAFGVVGLALLARRVGGEGRAPAAVLALAALAGAALALGPYWHVGGHRLPLPNRLLYEVYPVWRVVGRAAVLVWFAAAAALGVGLDALLARARTRPATVACRVGLGAAVLVAVLWGGASFRGGRPWYAADATPALSAALAARDGAVAEYPLFGQENDAFGEYLLRQTFHHRPLLNGAVPGTTSEALSIAAGHLDGPQTAAALQLAGVRTVAVHGPVAPLAGAVTLGTPDGATLLEPPAVADPAVATWRGTSPEESAGATRWRWLGTDPALVVTAPGAGRYRVRVLVTGAPGVEQLRFGDAPPVPVGEERAIEVCVGVPASPGRPLAQGTVTVTSDRPAPALGPTDPRRSWARVRDEQVVGRCP